MLLACYLEALRVCSIVFAYSLDIGKHLELFILHLNIDIMTYTVSQRTSLE